MCQTFFQQLLRVLSLVIGQMISCDRRHYYLRFTGEEIATVSLFPAGHTAGQWRSCTLSFLCGTCPSSDFSSPKTRPGICLLPRGDRGCRLHGGSCFSFVPESSNGGYVYSLVCFSDSLTCLEARTKGHRARNPKQSPENSANSFTEAEKLGTGSPLFPCA